MNPLTNIKNQNKITEKELEFGISGGSGKSWHQKYSDSAWIYIGGLPYELNEGDILAVFSQYGEIVNINLIRDHKTGKSRGFAFLCYQDQRSTILAVDNFNGITLLKRVIRVDHVEEYKVPKYREEVEEEIRKLWEEGCAPKAISIPKNVPSEEDIDPVKSMIRKGRMNKDGIIKLNVKLEKQIKKEKKLARKEEKRIKKEHKRLGKNRRVKEEAETIDVKVKSENIEKSWKEQKLVADRLPIDEEEIYGSNDHFNFRKPKNEIPAPSTHNLRPDFEKADWRDIEIWKAVREREKRDKGETSANWKEEHHYLPSRFQRE